MADIRAHDNQSGIDLTKPPAADRVFDVPLLRATALNLRGLGRPVNDFAAEPLDITPFPTSGWRKLCTGTGAEGGFVEDVFTNECVGAVQYSTNVGLGRRYVTGWYGNPAEAAVASPSTVPNRDFITTHEANYHPDGGQIICARDGASIVLLLAPPGDDVTPSSFRAFLVDPAYDGTIGVHINAGTWHQPAFPVYTVDSAPVVLDNRQGKVHGCVSVNFIEEFGGYLRVPLTSKDLLDDAEANALTAPSSLSSRLGYIILYTADVRRALDFYKEAFGLRQRFATPDFTYGELETGSSALAFASISQAQSNFPGDGSAFAVSSPTALPPAMEVGLIVGDITTAVEKAIAAGARLVAPVKTKPWGQQVAYVRDLDGLIVELCTAM